MAIPRMTKAHLAQRLQGAAAGAPPEAQATVPGAFRMTATDIPPAPLPPNRDIVRYNADPEALAFEGGGAPQFAIPVSGLARG
jgi:hypothetical protein